MACACCKAWSRCALAGSPYPRARVSLCCAGRARAVCVAGHASLTHVRAASLGARSRPPAEGAPLKQTVVLVADRELRDEELFLNYKLRPQGPLAEWYAPVAPAADRDARPG